MRLLKITQNAVLIGEIYSLPLNYGKELSDTIRAIKGMR